MTRVYTRRGVHERHGLYGIPEYWIWLQMRRRCLSPSHKQFKDWGGRGITICRRWDSFTHFLDDMGRRPANKESIERINNSKGYSPSNCKWGTRLEQNRNSRKAKLTLAKAKRIRVLNAAGVSYRLLAQRYNVSEFCIYSVVHNMVWKTN